MNRIKLLLKEEKKELKDIDIRRYDFYLSKKEQDEWDKRNILYNTLWFYLNKSNKYPEVEYSNTVTDIYKFLSPFKAWEIVYHGYGKVFDPPKYKHAGKKGRFCADIMTGWWNPFKYFLGLSDSISRESIEDMINNDKFPSEKESIEETLSLEEIEELSPEIINKVNGTKLVEWIQKQNSDISVKYIHKFLRFLRVVYTIGNIIPAPDNPSPGGRGGKGLDTWQYKLEYTIKGGNSVKWKNYIDYSFDGWNDFIESNYLKVYFDKYDKNFQKPKRFWKNEKLNSGTTATLDDWAEYFTNATDCINQRNDAIQGAINSKGDE